MNNFRPLYGDNYLPSNEGTIDSIQTPYGTEIETSAYDGYSPYVRSRMNPAHIGFLSTITSFAKDTASKAWTGVKSTASDAFDDLVGDTKQKAVDKATELGGETAGEIARSALNTSTSTTRNTSTSTTRKGGKGNSSQQKLQKALSALKGSGLKRVGRIVIDTRPNTPLYSSAIINQFPRSTQTLNQIRLSLGIRQQGSIFRLPTGEIIGVEHTKFQPIDIQLLLANKLKGFLDLGMPIDMAVRNLMNNHPYIREVSFHRDRLVSGTKRYQSDIVKRSAIARPTTPNSLSFHIGDGDSPRPRARELFGSRDWTMYEQALSTRVPSIESTILRIAPSWRTTPISRNQMRILADELAVNFGARVTVSNSQGKYTAVPETVLAQRNRVATQTSTPQPTPVQTQAADESTKSKDEAPAEDEAPTETPKEKPFLKTPLGITTAVLGTAAVLGGVYYIVSKD